MRGMHTECEGESRNIYNILAGRPEVKYDLRDLSIDEQVIIQWNLGNLN
jgi:hypothetical protein